nr:hypothetical protein [Micromonospora sp. CNB394]
MDCIPDRPRVLAIRAWGVRTKSGHHGVPKNRPVLAEERPLGEHDPSIVEGQVPDLEVGDVQGLTCLGNGFGVLLDSIDELEAVRTRGISVAGVAGLGLSDVDRDLALGVLERRVEREVSVVVEGVNAGPQEVTRAPAKS